MSSLLIIALVFGLALALIAIRLPIGLVLTVCAFIGVAVEASPKAALGLLSRLPFETATNWEFSAAPMFLFMGFVAARAGLTTGLFDASRLLLRRVPGALAVASVMASALFAAASGSSVATSAAMSRIAVPEMLKRGYDQGLACGTIAASGTLGSLIPPSLTLILFGIMADVSIGQLFLAGLLPGILSAVIYMTMIALRVTVKPALAGTPISRSEIEAVRWREVMWDILPLPILIALVMGSISAGWATPTESGALGAAGALVFILVGGALLVRFVALTGVSRDLVEFFEMIGGGPYLLLFFVAVVYIVLGMFIDPIGLLLLTIPVFLPIAQSMDMDLVWFGILLVKLLEIGLITPPVGLNIYVIKSTLGNLVDLPTIFRGIFWFIAMDLLTLIILIAWPQITLWLPSMMR